MNKFFNKMKKGVAFTLAATMVICGCVLNNATNAKADDVKKTYINKTYGYLKGEMMTSNSARDGKEVYTVAYTGKAVPRLRAYQTVHISSTGKQVDQDYGYWAKNVKQVHAECQLYHADPKNGYKNVKLTAYGTCDAIVEKAYAVYLSTQW